MKQDTKIVKETCKKLLEPFFGKLEGLKKSQCPNASAYELQFEILGEIWYVQPRFDFFATTSKSIELYTTNNGSFSFYNPDFPCFYHYGFLVKSDFLSWLYIPSEIGDLSKAKSFGLDYVFISDSQEIENILERNSKFAWVSSLFVLVGNGEYLEIWGSAIEIPYPTTSYQRIA